MQKKDFKILVADDDEIARDVICTLLLREGFSVIAASDGLDAIKILSLEDINLVITDLRMPGADGVEVLRYAMKNNPDIAVVILTAFGTLDTTLEAIKEGAYDYLTKPFKIQEMIILADRAYKRALLINENKELKRTLREINRIELLKTAADSNNPATAISWLERIEKLRSMNIITNQEFEIIKERLVAGNGEWKSLNN